MLRQLADQLDLMEDPYMQMALPGSWNLFGGIDGLLELPSRKTLDAAFLENQSRGMMAGASLFCMYWLNHHLTDSTRKNLSLSNVWAWLHAEGRRLFGLDATKNVFDNAWSTHRDVAHIWAGIFLYSRMGSIRRHPLDPVIQGLDQEPSGLNQTLILSLKRLNQMNDGIRHALAFAIPFQEFGLTYRAPRSKETLLNEATLYRVEKVPDWGIPFPDLCFPRWIDSFTTCPSGAELDRIPRNRVKSSGVKTKPHS